MLQVRYSLGSRKEKAKQSLCESRSGQKEGQDCQEAYTYNCEYYQLGREYGFLGCYHEGRGQRLPHVGELEIKGEGPKMYRAQSTKDVWGNAVKHLKQSLLVKQIILQDCIYSVTSYLYKLCITPCTTTTLKHSLYLRKLLITPLGNRLLRNRSYFL